MNNSYLIAGLIIFAVILGVLLRSQKTEAPVAEINQPNGATISTILDGSYDLQTKDSTITWEGEYLTGLSEKGTFGLSSGNFVVKDGFITSGEFVIDMNTIESIPHKDMLVNHLKADDFFGVATYPTAKFVLKKMIPASEEGVKVGRYVIAGDLTIRGITKPISFTTTLKPDDTGLEAIASFAINRADWEVKYNSETFFKDLKNKVIRDAVTIELDLKAVMVIQ